MNPMDVLIIGSHPILEDVKAQYLHKGFRILTEPVSEVLDNGIEPDEIFMATCPDSCDPFTQDAQNLSIIRRICSTLDKDTPIRVHMLLHSPDTLALFQQRDIDEDLKGNTDIFPFTIDSIWAQNLFCQIPCSHTAYPPLDREHITADSEKTIHLVIAGMNRMSETLAEYASLTCHFPNYASNHWLRTRITIIDSDIDAARSALINRHSALFDNCWYRFIDLDKKGGSAVTYLHKPQYDGIREDFTDIEWEFVSGRISDPKMVEKLKLWATSHSRQLTVILCKGDEGENISNLLQLPKEVEDNMATVFVRLNNTETSLMLAGRKNVKAFGMNDCGYDISLPLITLAKMTNHIYDCCYKYNYASDNGSTEVFAPVSIDKEMMETSWKKLSNAKKWSNIYNAMTISTKMRSLGYETDDWRKFYGMTAKEIAIIAEVEHNRWNVEEMLLGYRPVNEKQEKEIEADISRKKTYRNEFIHYDIRAYKDLRPDQSGKNVNTYDICLSSAIPLIAKTFIEEQNG